MTAAFLQSGPACPAARMSREFRHIVLWPHLRLFTAPTEPCKSVNQIPIASPRLLLGTKLRSCALSSARASFILQGLDTHPFASEPPLRPATGPHLHSPYPPIASSPYEPPRSLTSLHNADHNYPISSRGKCSRLQLILTSGVQKSNLPNSALTLALDPHLAVCKHYSQLFAWGPGGTRGPTSP